MTTLVWLLLAFSTFSLFAGPMFQGELADALLARDASRFARAVVTFAALRIFYAATAEGSDALVMRVKVHAQAVASEAVYAHFLHGRLDWLERRRKGEVVSKAEAAIGANYKLVSSLFMNLCPAMAEVVLAVAAGLWRFNVPEASWVLPVGVGLYIAVIYVGSRLQVQFMRVGNERVVGANAIITEALEAIETVKIHQAESAMVARLKLATQDKNAMMDRRWRVEQLANSAQKVIASVTTAVCAFYAGQRVLEGTLTAGEFTAFSLLIDRMFVPLTRTRKHVSSILTSLAAFDALASLLYSCDREDDLAAHDVPATQDGSDAPSATSASQVPDTTQSSLSSMALSATPRIRPDPVLRLENVHFVYPPRADAPDSAEGSDSAPVTASPVGLASVSFALYPGEVVALVGPSGAGKSTLVRVLLSLYRPASGSIWLGSERQVQWDPVALRRWISAAPQRVPEFSLSFRENITLGRDRGQEQSPAWTSLVARAVRAANLDGVRARLSRGLDTVLGASGVHLSGGELQRVGIARAFVGTHQRVLVADEATANLDAAAGTEVMASLRAWARDRQGAVLIIAHNLGLVVPHADRVLVLLDGRVVAAGAHDRLLRESPLYQRLWTLQDGHPEAPSAASPDLEAEGRDGESGGGDGGGERGGGVRKRRSRPARSGIEDVEVDEE